MYTSWENQQSAYAKTKTQISFAVTAKLISAFVFATQIVQFLFYLNPEFQDSSSFLCMYSPVCVGPVRKPHCWFSHEAAHISTYCDHCHAHYLPLYQLTSGSTVRPASYVGLVASWSSRRSGGHPVSEDC